MNDEPKKILCTLDHANKFREKRRSFDRGRLWLKQVETDVNNAPRNGAQPQWGRYKQQLK